ncbi:MAG: mechanosensitive ion channel [Betaproteobacteria bacterium]|nr:mechanosensitive ion channel [Betaproteobacteria bacterium]
MQTVTDSLEPLFLSLWKDLHDERILWQVATIAASLVLAYWLSYLLRPRLHAGNGSKLEFGMGGLRRLIFPLAALAFVLSGRWVLAHYQTSVSLLSIAVSLLTAMAIIRFVVHLQRLVFAPGNVLDIFERTIVWLVWLGFALYVLGLAPGILEFFDGVGFKVGGHRISLLLIGQAVVWVVVALLLALWIGRLLEERLMSAHGMDVTLRVMLSKLLRALLVLLAVLIVLPAVGIDLTALSVFGGALGVGIGFGLQKIASNYISGFIILLDRSVTIGDLVTIEKHTGKLAKMTARYVVVRALDGTEAIIPNETVITSTVINQSYTDRKVAISMTVQVSYDSDLDLAMRSMTDVAKRHVRALADPPPVVLIKAFADNGIDLELAVWVEDPEQGKTNLRSDIYYGIWREFKARGIVIPYPQREVRLVGGEPAQSDK